MTGDLIFVIVMAVVIVSVVIVVILSIAAAIIPTLGTFGIIGWVFKKLGDQQAQTQALLTTGEPAEATVLRLSDTGVTVNDNPLVHLLLEVRTPGREPFHAEAQWTVSRLQTSLFQPGSVIQVRYDPNDPTRVVFERAGAREVETPPSDRDELAPRAFACPSCGAPLDYAGGAPTIRCPYCDTSVAVPGELRD